MYYLKKRRSKEPTPKSVDNPKAAKWNKFQIYSMAPHRKIEQMRRPFLLNVKNFLNNYVCPTMEDTATVSNVSL